MREKEYFDALCNTADGVFIVDSNKRILRWNRAAEKMLGHLETDVLNRECYRVLSGKDLADKPHCSQNCRIHSVALKGTPQKNYDMMVQSSEGTPLWVNVSILSNPDPAEPFVAHVVRDITEDKKKALALEQFLSDLNTLNVMPKELSDGLPPVRIDQAKHTHQANKQSTILSDREIEVLKLLAEGLSTKILAQRLSISHFTARNHIQNILVKLNLHSKAQAVSYAYKKGIL